MAAASGNILRLVRNSALPPSVSHHIRLVEQKIIGTHAVSQAHAASEPVDSTKPFRATKHIYHVHPWQFPSATSSRSTTRPQQIEINLFAFCFVLVDPQLLPVLLTYRVIYIKICHSCICYRHSLHAHEPWHAYLALPHLVDTSAPDSSALCRNGKIVELTGVVLILFLPI